MTDVPKVFISYSHDSQSHRDFVRKISDRLRTDGLHCVIDQYINGFPPEGWQKWMQNQIKAADFVLLVCTETYLRRYEGDETVGGMGATFEGVVISQNLYENYYHNTKFIPILPGRASFQDVPLPLKQFSAYTLLEQYDDLYRYLSKQPKYIAPPVGIKRVMPPKKSTPNNDSGAEISATSLTTNRPYTAETPKDILKDLRLQTLMAKSYDELQRILYKLEA